MEIATFGNVAAITVICMLLAQIIKTTKLDNKWLPALCGLMGAVLGAIGFYMMPEYPAQDILTAIAIGIMSGLAATGVHQTFKQIRTNS